MCHRRLGKPFSNTVLRCNKTNIAVSKLSQHLKFIITTRITTTYYFTFTFSKTQYVFRVLLASEQSTNKNHIYP